MKQDFLFNMSCVSETENYLKVHVIQSRNGTKMNISTSVKNYMIGALVKMIICGILVQVIVSLKMHVKLTNIQISKIFHVTNVYLEKLLLACEDEILNTTEISNVDRKIICEKIIALFTLSHW